MPRGVMINAFAKAATKIPGLKRLPVLKLLARGETAVVARDHRSRLEPRERRRLMELVGAGRGRPQNLTPPEREELETLVAKVEPRLFAGEVADRLSPVPLPKRVVRGPK